ncbi:MAG TPA: hypothetical protein VGL66_16840 [Caulobacteraceae bacterium]|jgi:hypothetical protein
MKRTSNIDLVYAFQLARCTLAPTKWLHPRYLRDQPDETDDDERANKHTRLTEGQGIDFSCIWAVEFYPPSRIEALIDSLEKFGLEKMLAGTGRPDQSPIRWLRELRTRPSGGGWLNLGYLFREKRRYMSGLGMEAPLPEFAEIASLAMFSVAPSFVAITATFFVRDEYSKQYEDEIQTDRTTVLKPLPRGYSMIGPESQKRRSIARLRSGYRGQIRDWFKDALPGLFSGSEPQIGPPVCELLLLEGGEPFAKGAFGSATDVLGVQDWYLAYEAEQWPGLKFSPTVGRDGERHMHAVLVADSDQLPSVKDKGYGSDRSSHAHYFDRSITSLMVQWGAIAALSHFELRLSQIRDLSVGWTARNARRTLAELQTLNIESLDLTSVCRDFASMETSWTGQPTFRPIDPRDADHGNLSDGWGRWIASRAKRALEEDAAVKGLTTQHANILAARENLNLQWSVRAVTIVALVISAIATAEPGKHLADHVYDRVCPKTSSVSACVWYSEFR